MILSRLLRDIFSNSKHADIDKDYGDGCDENFVRDKSRPSLLVMTHSYSGNGAAEMLVFLLRFLLRELNWQVSAYSEGLSDHDLSVLKGEGVRIVSSIHTELYDFGIVNTVVSGLGYLEKVGGSLPCVLWVHEGETVLWSSRLPLGYWKRAFSTAAHIIFQSQWQAERIFGSFTSALPERYSVVRNCLPPLAGCKDVSIPPKNGKKRILFIGGIYERKRPGDLVEAVVSMGRWDVECYLIGSKALLNTLPKRIQALINSDSRFKLIGEISREAAYQYLCSADVLSLPSGDESQPLVLLEAASCGVPIVISDLQVYREVWHDGENCLKHAVGDISAIAGHLKRCIDGKCPSPVLSSSEENSVSVFLEDMVSIFNKIEKHQR